MTALYIIAGIILFFVILFSLRFTVIIDYGEETVVTLKYLFIKIPVVDTSKPEKEKKPKKEKKQKKKQEPEQTEPVTDVQEEQNVQEVQEGKTTPPKEKKKGNSLLKQLYLDQGYYGIQKMFKAVGDSLGGFFGKLYKTIVFDEFYLTMITAGSDAADTAIKHGKLCAWLFPVLGKLVSTSKFKKYDVDITPDFLATKSTASAYIRLHVTPIHITNGAIVLGVQLLFKVLFKVLFAKKKSDKSKVVKSAAEEILEFSKATDNDTKNKTNINKDGASS